MMLVEPHMFAHFEFLYVFKSIINPLCITKFVHYTLDNLQLLHNQTYYNYKDVCFIYPSFA
jgi:hypothetical protein